MCSRRTLAPALAIAAAMSLASCEKSTSPDSSAETLKPLIHAVESAADDFDKLWTEAKRADVTADLRTLSTKPTTTRPPLQNAEKENRIADDARQRLRELSSDLEAKLQALPDQTEAIAFARRMEIRKKIENLTTELVSAIDRERILDDLRDARSELDALRPKFETSKP